jgi:hypothetical protein
VVKRCGVSRLDPQDDLVEDQHPASAQQQVAAPAAGNGDRTARRPPEQSALSAICAPAEDRHIAKMPAKWLVLAVSIEIRSRPDQDSINTRSRVLICSGSPLVGRFAIYVAWLR